MKLDFIEKYEDILYDLECNLAHGLMPNKLELLLKDINEYYMDFLKMANIYSINIKNDCDYKKNRDSIKRITQLDQDFIKFKNTVTELLENKTQHKSC